MHLILKFDVNAPIKKVWEGFDQNLFEALAPPFPPVEVVKFGGCLTGDKVALKLSFLIFSQMWESDITAHQITTNQIWFDDVGTKLPFFLQSWRHRHQLDTNISGGTTITENIAFNAPWWLPNILLYPTLYFQFKARGPIYRKYFNTKNG